jgi:hypothetical protein
VQRVTLEYVSEVVGVFTDQASEAVRNRKFPAALLDRTVEFFVKATITQAHSGVQSDKIRGAFAINRFEDVNSQLRPKVMSTPRYLAYLSEVPEILRCFGDAESSEGSPRARERTGYVKPKLAQKGWSVLQWAKTAGVSQAVAYDYLNDKSDPRADNRRALAEALGVQASDLQ